MEQRLKSSEQNCVFLFHLSVTTSFLISLSIQKTGILSIQNKEKERRYPWDAGYLTKAFEKGLKAGGLLDLVCASKYILHKSKLILCMWFFSLLLTVEQTSKSTWESLAHCPRADLWAAYSQKGICPQLFGLWHKFRTNQLTQVIWKWRLDLLLPLKNPLTQRNGLGFTKQNYTLKEKMVSPENLIWKQLFTWKVILFIFSKDAQGSDQPVWNISKHLLEIHI